MLQLRDLSEATSSMHYLCRSTESNSVAIISKECNLWGPSNIASTSSTNPALFCHSSSWIFNIARSFFDRIRSSRLGNDCNACARCVVSCKQASLIKFMFKCGSTWEPFQAWTRPVGSQMWFQNIRQYRCYPAEEQGHRLASHRRESMTDCYETQSSDMRHDQVCGFYYFHSCCSHEKVLVRHISQEVYPLWYCATERGE